MPRIHRPRIVTDVPEELYQRYVNCVPWGDRNAMMANIIEQLVDTIEKKGKVVIYLLADNRITLFGESGTLT